MHDDGIVCEEECRENGEERGKKRTYLKKGLQLEQKQLQPEFVFGCVSLIVS